MVLGVVVALAIALFWIWIFSGAARRQNPDFLDDRAWVARARATCSVTAERIDERTRQTFTSPADRADAIEAGNRDLKAMLAELRAPLPESGRDRAVVTPWLDDWTDLLDDRASYAVAVRIDGNARFLTREKFNDPLDRVVQTFAEVNEMKECAPPGDVG